jgi:hypothetical protein
MATDRLRYINPDASGTGTGLSLANAYVSQNIFEAAEQGNFVSLDVRVIGECYSTSGTADTTNVIYTGSTTDSTRYWWLRPGTGNEAEKDQWYTNRYRFEAAFIFRDGTGIVDNLQLKGLAFSEAIKCDFSSAGTLTIRKNRIDQSNSSTEGIEINSSNVDVIIQNNIISNNGGTLDTGININSAASAKIYCNTIRECSDGIYIASGNTVTVKNNAIFVCSGADINDNASSTIDRNAMDDGSPGTNIVSPLDGDWDNEFVDPANDDFTILNTGNLYDAGVGPSTDSNCPTDDMEDDARSGTTTDIGADEYVAAGIVASLYAKKCHNKMAGTMMN